MTRFDALPGYYKFIFLYFEPLSEIGPFVTSFIWGPQWFYNELVPPTGPPPEYLDPRSTIAVWQLTICYLLLCFMTSLGYRAVRDTLSDNPAGQEKLMGVFLISLAIADLTHIYLTFVSLPQDIKYLPLQWNTTTHGNLSVVFLLHLSRVAWFLGIGRKRYYFGQTQVKAIEAK